MVLFMKDDQEDELEPEDEEFCDDCNRTLDDFDLDDHPWVAED